MRKRAILALLLVLALAVTTSCSLIVKDAEVDKQTTIIEVAGKTITKEEVNEQTEAVLDYQDYMYYLYGLSFDRTSADSISAAQQSAIEGLVQQAVLEQKIAEMGFDQFTDEEIAEMEASVETTYTTYVETVTNQSFADTELTGEELEAAIAAEMATQGYPTREQLMENERQNSSLEKLEAEVVKDVAVTDEEISTEYQTRLGAAMTTYGNTPAQYGADVQNGSTVYYVPAGYRYVKHILRNFTDEDQTKITDLNSQISSKNSELTTAQTSLNDLGEAAEDEDADAAKVRASLVETVDRLTTEIAELQTQLADATEAAYAAIQPTVDEIFAKLAAGEDFDALMEEYGEDPGMQSSPNKETGYLVSDASTNWVTEFKDGAMALASIGDVSGAVRSSYGIHIIRYVSDAVEGEVGLDAVKDAIRSELLTAKQNELYNTTVETWINEADARIYADRMN